MANRVAVGKGIPRIDTPVMVTGKAVYAVDIKLPGMLYGKILRSPYPHARIKSININKAEKFPGIRGVVTAADVPGVGVFAKEKVLYLGEKVAAVAADDPYIAEEALNLIEVEYEIFTAVIDPLEAMKPDAPIVRDDLPSKEVFDENGVRLNNIAGYSKIEEGDVVKALTEADVVVEGSFRTPVFHQGYIEPHAAVAYPEPDGGVTVWTTTQGLYRVRNSLATALKLPMIKIKVLATEVGGGFGGKNYVHVETVAALLAQKTGRPVKLIDTRQEVFLDSKPAPACITTIKVGAKKDGTITAIKAKAVWDAGASGGGGSAGRLRGLYKAHSFSLEGFGVYTNKLTPGAYRAPGAPQMAFVRESMIDILAEKLGIDPLVLRMKNAVEEGDISISGNPLPRVGFKETLQAAAERSNWGAPLKEGCGRGIACGEWTNFVGSSAAYVMVNEDGTVQVITGSVDVTGTRTTFAQIVSEELKVPIEEIRVSLGDTWSMPYHDLSAGSRTTYATGTAVLKAVREVKERVLRMASETLGVAIEQLELIEKGVREKGASGRSVSLSELAMASISSSEGSIFGRGIVGPFPSRPAYSVHVAEVEVDVETGVVRLLRLVAAQDVGFALNPMSVEGQIQGGATQAIGYGLTEGYIYDEKGYLLNHGFLDYPLPTSMDVPPIEPVLVEVENPDGPYGAKGAGEPPIIPTAAAIANAIYNACGARVTELPIVPERVVKALKKEVR